jgi:hypothetical protein
MRSTREGAPACYRWMRVRFVLEQFGIKVQRRSWRERGKTESPPHPGTHPAVHPAVPHPQVAEPPDVDLQRHAARRADVLQQRVLQLQGACNEADARAGAELHAARVLVVDVIVAVMVAVVVIMGFGFGDGGFMMMMMMMMMMTMMMTMMMVMMMATTMMMMMVVMMAITCI